MSAYDNLASSFCEWYYQTFNTNRAELANIYTPDSLMTLQMDLISGYSESGQLAIIEKVMSPQLAEMTKQYHVFTAQPSVSDTVLICVQGDCKMTLEEAESIGFQEIFLIAQHPSTGAFFVINQVFITTGF